MRPADDVDKFLSEEKEFDDRRQALIDALLKQKAAAIKEFDDKLAKLGHGADGATRKRSHHRKAAAAEVKPKTEK